MKVIKLMSEGKDRVGLDEYTRFPLGPAYIQYPFYKIGLSNIDRLRLVPIIVGALSMTFLYFVLLQLSQNVWLKIWSTVFCFVYILQPAMYEWQSMVYSLSFALSAIIFMSAIAIKKENVSPLVWFGIGFVSGWIGYTFLIGQVVILWVLRFLFISQSPTNSVQDAFLGASRETIILISGILFAIFTHLVQVWIYYQSFFISAMDIFGSAILRMGVETNDMFFRFYSTSGKPQIGTFELLPNILSSWSFFLNGFVWKAGEYVYARPGWLGFMGIFGVFLMGANLGRLPHRLSRFLLQISIWIIGIIISAIGWFIVMSHHAAFHLFYINRLYLMSVLLFGIGPILILSERMSTPIYLANISKKTFLKDIILYSLPGLPIVYAIYIIMQVRV